MTKHGLGMFVLSLNSGCNSTNNVTWNGHNIEWTSPVKYLGLNIDNFLSGDSIVFSKGLNMLNTVVNAKTMEKLQ